MSISASDGANLRVRSGMLGVWDQIVGPGATWAENIGSALFMLSGGVGAPLSAYLRGFAWNGWQYLVIAVIGADLVGGVWANSTLTTRRWYHRPGQRLPQHLGFAALHVYPFLIAWLFRGDDWGFAVGNYSLLLVAVLIVALSPERLQKPLATVLFAAILLLNMTLWAPTPGVEWFIPIYFLKTLIGHAPALESTAPSLAHEAQRPAGS